jgi:hypothetical protein
MSFLYTWGVKQIIPTKKNWRYRNFNFCERTGPMCYAYRTQLFGFFFCISELLRVIALVVLVFIVITLTIEMHVLMLRPICVSKGARSHASLWMAWCFVKVEQWHLQSQYLVYREKSKKSPCHYMYLGCSFHKQVDVKVKEHTSLFKTGLYWELVCEVGTADYPCLELRV